MTEKESMIRADQERGKDAWPEDRRVLLEEIDSLRQRLESRHKFVNDAEEDSFTSKANLDWVQAAVDFGHDATIANAWSELKADVRHIQAERESLRHQLATAEQQRDEAKDEVSRLDGACWYCSNPDIEDPWRHEHDVEGHGVIGHWHHCLDPGDGLPSACANSDRLERIFQEFAAALGRADAGTATQKP